jgi:hypothetical protein
MHPKPLVEEHGCPTWPAGTQVPLKHAEGNAQVVVQGEPTPGGTRHVATPPSGIVG